MNCAILLAAGSGKRFGSDKLFADLNGMPVVEHTLQNLQQSPFVDAIWIATHKNNHAKLVEISQRYSKVSVLERGGVSRFQSVKKVISHMEPCDLVIIQNGANPLTPHAILEKTVRVVRGDIAGAAPAMPVVPTIKERKKDGTLVTLDRTNLFLIETPQVVRYEVFMTALKKVSGTKFTDDLSVLEAAGFKTKLVPTHPHNIKITLESDLEYARFVLGAVTQQTCIGVGEDSHFFVPMEGVPRVHRCLRLGGIELQSHPPMDADSDGDVILHALCNAIASSIGEGSLGTYATGMARKGQRDSAAYLKVILKKMRDKKFSLLNCALSIEGTQPQIDPLVPRLKTSLSMLLDIPETRIGITAHTGKKLTPFGRGEAMKCTANVLVARS
ncbi:2-C-methyl-D-erythritol 2,4-cyclodiphosphate synthase [Candidatus Peregrinibacteria bacterium CG11_big_fil_rev_8_21_14_0_20_46_8]|nr:MAG: 2-C-methyl-D-erythritol 2,4-cyclodiphosphate synthase [Candidatus Peregrinibacteria bacterium CG11_big_fil_rev_8_21_14_0_20_46_8]